VDVVEVPVRRVAADLARQHETAKHLKFGLARSRYDNRKGIIHIVNFTVEIDKEITRAQQARQRGNEGQARVCARRAAGIAVREHLKRKGTPSSNPSAIDLLNLIKDDPILSPELKLIASHLTLRVNEEFKLPVKVDLIAEAKVFCEELLK